jgi:RNA polymerase sigma factor (sigma-70 family)
VSRLVEIRVADELIRSARGGDDAARSCLYAALAPATFGLIRRLVGASAVAEDLFQETLMTVFERLDTFRGEAPLGAWVRQIAVSRCLMYLRSPWHRARLDVGAWMDEPVGLELPTAAAPSGDTVDVERALASLSPTARAVVWLYEVEGYSHQEIASAFGRTESFSKSQLSRAHRRLRDWLEPRGEREPCAPI